MFKGSTITIEITNSSAELPDKTRITMTLDQFNSLWRMLELPYQRALNKAELQGIYNFEVKYN